MIYPVNFVSLSFVKADYNLKQLRLDFPCVISYTFKAFGIDLFFDNFALLILVWSSIYSRQPSKDF